MVTITLRSDLASIQRANLETCITVHVSAPTISLTPLPPSFPPPAGRW